MKFALNEELVNIKNLSINKNTSYDIDNAIKERQTKCYLQMNLLYSLLSDTVNNPHNLNDKILVIKEHLATIDEFDNEEISNIKTMPLNTLDDVLAMAPVAYRVYIGMEKK